MALFNLNQRIPVQLPGLPSGQGRTLKNTGSVILYYGLDQNVSSSHNTGSISPGASVDVQGAYYVVAVAGPGQLDDEPDPILAGGGSVASVTAGDGSITIGGTSSNPTVKVTPGMFGTAQSAFDSGLIVTRTPNAVVVAAFPTVSVLDNFGRTAESPLSQGGNWAGFTAFDPDPLILVSSGNVSVASTLGCSYRTDITAVADQEALVTTIDMGVSDAIYLFMRVGTPTAGTWTGYRVKWQKGNVAMYKSDGTLLNNVNFVYSPGDVFGNRMIGQTMHCYHNGTDIMQVSDATFTSGTIAVGISTPTAAISSFSAGAVVEATSGGAYAETDIIFVPPATGIAATDTPNIQGAIAAGLAAVHAKLIFGAGNYLVNDSLQVNSHVHWQGAGEEATIITLAAAVNKDLVQGATGLLGTVNAGGVYGWSISDMTLDQNGPNQTNTTESYCMRVYGFYYRLNNVKFDNGNWGGIWSEWAETGAGHQIALTGASDGAGDVIECRWDNVHVNNYIGPPSASRSWTAGVYFNGPHDSKWSKIFISSFRSNHTTNGPVTYGLFVGAQTLALHIDTIHVYGRHTHSFYGTSRCVFVTNIYIESGTVASITMNSQWSITGGFVLGTNSQSLQGQECAVQLGDNGAITGNTFATFGSQMCNVYVENYTNQSAPASPAVAVSGSGSAFAGGQQYFWKITAVDSVGETVGSVEVNATPAAGQNAVLTWSGTAPAANNVTTYRIWRSTTTGGQTGATSLVDTLTSPGGTPATVTYTDLGNATTTGAIPTVNTSGGRAMNFVNSNGGNILQFLTNAPATALYKGTVNALDTLFLLPQSFVSSSLVQFPAGSGTSSLQIFTANGTWHPPAGAKVAQVICIGGGGGGASGQVQASGTASVGGSGGGGGGMSQITLGAQAVNGATITVGAGGAGGAAIATNSTGGAVGTGGGLSRFGSQVQALGGAGSSGGAGGQGLGGAGTTTGGPGATSISAGTIGAQPAISGAAGGGGPGGGITTASAVANGAAGGQGNAAFTGGGTAGTAGGSGGVGGAHNGSAQTGGGGGGGGAASLTAAGAGGDGGSYGGGGGGGGAAQNGGTSGAGGHGSDGVVVVATW